MFFFYSLMKWKNEKSYFFSALSSAAILLFSNLWLYYF